MSRGFGAAYGVGASDAIITGYSVLPPSKRTYSIWVFINGTGGGNLGRIWDAAGASANANDSVFISVSGVNIINYARNFSTTGGNWFISAPPNGTWFHLAITYDAASIANDPIFYMNGTPITPIENATPSGTLNTTSNAYYLGNRQNTGNRNWDGMLAYFTMWEGVFLDQGEIRALACGAHPMSINPDSIVCCVPLDGANRPEFDYRNAPAGIIAGTGRGRSEPQVEFFYPDMMDLPDFPVAPTVARLHPLMGPLQMRGFVP